VISVIGIVLLIGIVKKNAIMMIDFPRRRGAEGGQGPRGGDLPGVPAPLPADSHDDDGGAALGAAADARTGVGSSCATRSGITMVGGLIVSQALTLFTNARDLPVVRPPRAPRRRPRADAPRRGPLEGR